MIRDDEFEPKFGKIRSSDRAVERAYRRQVLRAVARAGRSYIGARRPPFQGNRIGRGAGVGRVLYARDHHARYRVRRVIIKTRIVRLQGPQLKVAQAHLRYLQRDGVTREGRPGELYDAVHEGVEAKSFLARAEGDRHQFRFIVSAEDAVEYDDLKSFARGLMSQVEQDLGTTLDWIAVDHYTTGHPHTHIVVRGKDDRGKDLIIARAYLAQGMRERAAEIVSFDLGPRSDREIAQRLRQQVEQERFTSLDRNLWHDAGASLIVRFDTGVTDAFHQVLRAGRLQKLRQLGLAEEIGPGRWRLDRNLEPVLRRLGERGDIIKTVHRELTAAGLTRAIADYVIDDDNDRAPLVGRVVCRGLADERTDRHYLIIDGTDGRSHYLDIGQSDATDPTPTGAVIAIAPTHAEPRAVDRAIADIAATQNGRYSAAIHRHHDPTAATESVMAHVRRLEAMRRSGVAVERQSDGTWIIQPDHLARATAYDGQRTSPVKLSVLSTLPLDQQINADGATWLDRELIAKTPVPIRETGYGREVRGALDRRRQWLIDQGLAVRRENQVVYQPGLLRTLQQRELVRVGDEIAGELGKRYDDAARRSEIEGIYRRRLDLVSGRFAVIERSRDFTLVPWRPELERNRGRFVSGVIRDHGVSWTLTRRRDLSL